MRKEWKTKVNKELNRIGIPLDHEHAMYFRDGYEFAQEQLLNLPVVNRSLKEKYTQTFEEFMTNFCRYGITLTNNNTRETIGLKDLIQKWKLTNEVKH